MNELSYGEGIELEGGFDISTQIGSVPLAQPSMPAAQDPSQPQWANRKPGFFDTLSATWGDSWIATGVDYLSTQFERAEPGYNSMDEIRGTRYEQDPDWFSGSRSRAETAERMRMYDESVENRRLIEASPWYSQLAAGLAVGVADPTILIPVAGAVSKINGGYNITRSALRGGASIGAVVAGQELVSQATNPLRTAEESAFNVGAGLVLGSLLGGASAYLLSPAQAKSAMNGYDSILKGSLTGRGGLSAQENIGATAEQLEVDGGWLTKTALGVTRGLNPVTRASARLVSSAKEAMGRLMENPLYSKGEAQGLTLGPSAETKYRTVVTGRLRAAVEESELLYSNMRQSGANMSRDEFEEAIGRAMRRGDEGENDFISKAASAWRKKVFDPFKDEAIRNGLLPSDVSQETAVSYFSRVWNADKLRADERNVVDAVFTPYFERVIAQDFEASRAGLTKHIKDLEDEVATLKLSAEDRKLRVQALESEAEQFDAANADMLDLSSEVLDYRRQIRAIGTPKSLEDENTIAALKAAVKSKTAAAGKRYADFREQQAKLRKEKRLLSKSVSAMQEKQARIQDKLLDLELKTIRDFDTTVSTGRKLQKDIQAHSLGPEQVAESLKEFSSRLQKLSKQHEASLKIYADRRAKLEEDALKAREKREQKAQAAAEKGAPLKGEDLAEAAEKKFEADMEKVFKLDAEAADKIAAIRNQIAEIENRAAALSEFDTDEVVEELKAALDDLIELRADRALARGEKAVSLRRRLETSDPNRALEMIKAREEAIASRRQKFLDRWEGEKLGDDVTLDGSRAARFSQSARELAQDTFNTLTGRFSGRSEAVHPEWMVPVTRGPMKDRSFHIPDELVEGYLNSNVRAVGERYARLMGGENALVETFGESATLQKTIDKINKDYAELNDKVSSAKTVDEAVGLLGGRGKSSLDSLRAWMSGEQIETVTKARLAKFIEADRKSAITDFEAVRDMLRGTYKAAENASGFGRFARTMNGINYVTLSGGFTISSLAELYRPAMAHGLVNHLGNIKSLFTQVGASAKVSKELVAAGLMSERWLQHRVATMAELGDPFNASTGFEKFVQSLGSVATKFNGIAMFQDFNDFMAGSLAQNRILSAGAPDVAPRELANLGLDASMLGRINKMFKEHGETVDNLKIANTDKWKDQDAAWAFRYAINKDTSMVSLRPGFGDLPLWARTPAGKMLLQFRSFALASHQRILLRGLQEGKAQFLIGLVNMSIIGMFVATLSAMRRGDESFEKWKTKVDNDPSFLVGEGLDRSGIFALLFELSNAVEAASGAGGGDRFNPVKAAISAPFGGGGNTPSSRTLGRDLTSVVAGPTFGLLLDRIPKAVNGIRTELTGGDMTKAQGNALQGLIPFGTFIGVKEMLQLINGDSPFVQTEEGN